MNCHICNKKYFYYYTLYRKVHSCFDCGIEILGLFPCINYIYSINIKTYIFEFDIEPTYSDINIYDSKDYFAHRNAIREIKKIWEFGIESTKIEQENVNSIINILNKYTENLMFV